MMPSWPFRVHMLSVLAISPAFCCDTWGKWSHVLLIKSGVVGPFLNSLWVNHGLVYSWLNFWMSKAFAGRKLQLMLLFECRPTFFDFYNAIHMRAFLWWTKQVQQKPKRPLRVKLSWTTMGTSGVTEDGKNGEILEHSFVYCRLMFTYWMIYKYIIYWLVVWNMAFIFP